MKTIQAYHFTADTLRDERPVPFIGEWLRHDGPVVPCESGLHASECPFDALQYAPGRFLHRVELRGDIQSHGTPVDKLVARERRIVASINATDLLRRFARWSALQVIHLWDAPSVVREYLETGDQKLRTAAWDAAKYTAKDAAWDAAKYAAKAATSEPTWNTMWNAAWATAKYAAKAAASEATWNAAKKAAKDAARDAQRTEFRRLVSEAFTTTP